MNELDLIKEKIEALQSTFIPVNYWEGTKYKPYTIKLVKLEDILKILELIEKLTLK